jgi:hypothetical protein
LQVVLFDLYLSFKGIFHPEANAHRAHCQYLVKLNRGISCETIEDPVLIRMYVEYLKEERVRGVELSAEQKKYLELLDQGEKKRTQEERLFRLLTKSPKISRLKPLQSKSKGIIFSFLAFLIFS